MGEYLFIGGRHHGQMLAVADGVEAIYYKDGYQTLLGSAQSQSAIINRSPGCEVHIKWLVFCGRARTECFVLNKLLNVDGEETIKRTVRVYHPLFTDRGMVTFGDLVATDGVPAGEMFERRRDRHARERSETARSIEETRLAMHRMAESVGSFGLAVERFFNHAAIRVQASDASDPAALHWVVTDERHEWDAGSMMRAVATRHSGHDPLHRSPRAVPCSPALAMMDGFDGPAGEARAADYLKAKAAAAIRFSTQTGHTNESNDERVTRQARGEELIKKLGFE